MTENIKTIKKLTPVIFGDSHTRSFVNENIKNIIFAGPGKSINFLSLKNMLSIFKKIYEVNKGLDDVVFVLVFGEPDLRFHSYRDFTFKNIDANLRTSKVFRKINRSFFRFKLLIFLLKIFKIDFMTSGVHSPNLNLQDVVNYWNRKLQNLSFEMNIKYFEIKNYFKNGKLDNIYQAYSIHNSDIKDHVHLSNHVGIKFFDNFKKEFIFNSKLQNSKTKLVKNVDFKVYEFNTSS